MNWIALLFHRRFYRHILRGTCFAFLAIVLLDKAAAQSLIRDTEVEAIIRTFATPVWLTAGLDPKSVKVILINDPTLNAFVAEGQNIFIHTGLLMRSQNAGQVIGVLAHETGHMAHGDLARQPDALRNATISQLVGLILGAAAAVTTGNGGAIQGGIGIGTSIAERNLFAFSRAVEARADQAGVIYLDQTHQSAKGLMQFMQVLHNEETLNAISQDPYLTTHPLTPERIEFIQNHIAHSAYSDVPISENIAALHRRMRAKLVGFLQPISRVQQIFTDDDKSVEARYARTIAYYRIPDLDKALPLIDGLIAENPKDPYFYELKAQMLFENARGGEAVAPYRIAVKLKPDAPLIRISLAQVLLETENAEFIPEALTNLKAAAIDEGDNPDLWRWFAVAYGRTDRLGEAAEALAEQALLEGHDQEAHDQARRAMRILPTGSPDWLRAQDIDAQTKHNKSDRG